MKNTLVNQYEKLAHESDSKLTESYTLMFEALKRMPNSEDLLCDNLVAYEEALAMLGKPYVKYMVYVDGEGYRDFSRCTQEELKAYYTEIYSGQIVDVEVEQ